MQIYTKGSVEAVATYQRAFNAELGYNVKHENGTYYHSELNVYGQVLAVAERADNTENNTGNVMQFCLHFDKGEEDKIDQAYNTLKEGAQILVPLGPCDFSTYMTDFIDKFGVRWCLFV